MLDLILSTANRYADGFKSVTEKRALWQEKYKEVRDHLTEVADYLNANALYKPGFFVDTNHAFCEENNGTCAEMASLTFRSGAMPLHITFTNDAGELKEYIEEGFHITFFPTITGEILVMLQPHYNNVTTEKAGFMDLAVVDGPASLTPEIVDQIVAKGMEIAFYSSFTGLTEQQNKAKPEPPKKYQHAPIGFKRFDSTEKDA